MSLATAYIEILATRGYNPIGIFVFADNRPNVQVLAPDGQLLSIHKELTTHWQKGVNINHQHVSREAPP